MLTSTMCYAYVCESCSTQGPPARDSAKDARLAAIEAGWTFIELGTEQRYTRVAICPKCSE